MAWIIHGHKRFTEAVGSRRSVGEHSIGGRRCQVIDVGPDGKANVGISNDKGGEKPPRRKTKGS